MRILIAEDDRVSRQILTNSLTKWGYEVVVTLDGHQAWEELQKKRRACHGYPRLDDARDGRP